jgi:hypothetical protein
MAIESFLGTRAQRVFFGTIILQGIVVLAMIGITYGMVDFSVNTRLSAFATLPCYLALFVRPSSSAFTCFR